MNTNEKRGWGLVICFALACAALLYGWASLRAIPDRLQYLWPAPPQVQPTASGDAAAQEETDAGATNAGLADARGKLEAFDVATDGALESATLYAIRDGCTLEPVSEDGESAVCRLEAVRDEYFALHNLVLLTGRLPYPDELNEGRRVILLDEGLAVALFRYAEPIDRQVTIGGERYRVVGIVKHGKRVGDHQEYRAWMGYRAAETSAISLDALCLEAAPIPGAGSLSAFTSAVGAFDAGGTLISTQKLKMNAAMPLRLLLCALGLAVGLLWLRGMNRRARESVMEHRARLRETYFAQFWGRTLLRALLLALGYAAGVAVLALVFAKLIEPVYTFPEWVPAVLVEPNDIATAFWNVWQGSATLLEYRTPELLRARFFQTVLGWSAGACALLGGALFARGAGRLRRKAKGDC